MGRSFQNINQQPKAERIHRGLVRHLIATSSEVSIRLYIEKLENKSRGEKLILFQNRSPHRIFFPNWPLSLNAREFIAIGCSL